MKTLKNLTFATPPAEQKNHVAARRAKLVARLEEQKRLAEDPEYARVVQKWVRGETGARMLIDLSKRLQPWWKTDATGATYLKVRCGAKAIEFEGGRAILIENKSQLAAVFETLIAAANAGELDNHLQRTDGGDGAETSATAKRRDSGRTGSRSGSS